MNRYAPCVSIMISTCIIASREEIHRETTIASARAPGSMALRDSLDLPDPLIYSLISARYSIVDLYTHTHIHTYVRPVKFYGSGCPERFLDYTHLKKIPHESLQHRRVFTRRLHFSDVSVNSPLSTGVHESLSGVVDAKGLPLELCARSAGLQRGACLLGSRWMTACPTTRNDTLGIIRLIIFRRAAPPFSSLCFTIFVHHFNLN